MRKKLASFLGWAGFLALTILATCVAFLPYVGVYITYICLPIAVISLFLWSFLRDKTED